MVDTSRCRDDDGMVACLHQAFSGKSAGAGFGNCRKCVNDEFNKQCVGYRAARVWAFEVNGRGERELC